MYGARITRRSAYTINARNRRSILSVARCPRNVCAITLDKNRVCWNNRGGGEENYPRCDSYFRERSVSATIRSLVDVWSAFLGVYHAWSSTRRIIIIAKVSFPRFTLSFYSFNPISSVIPRIERCPANVRIVMIYPVDVKNLVSWIRALK